MAGIAARARPRRRSFNLRRLRYVLVREAALRILFAWSSDLPTVAVARRELIRLPTDKVVRLATRRLASMPWRTFWFPRA